MSEATKKANLTTLLSVAVPVHLISTPFRVEQGVAAAQVVKDKNHAPPERYCYNPNTDAPQDEGGGWLQSWMRVCKKTKETGGTVFMVFNQEKDGAYGDGEYKGCFDGQAQQGELELATLHGCPVEWVGYTRDRAAEARAREERERQRIANGGCVMGGEHNWQYHQGKDGTGRACFKCLDVHDLATGKPVWWCASADVRQLIIGGGCPATNGASHHRWMNSGPRSAGSGRCCEACGFTESDSGEIKLLPQLLGAFGPPKANPRVANH